MRYQPQGLARLSASSPLQRGLVTYQGLTGKSYADAVDRLAWAPSPAGSNPVVFSGAPRGAGLLINGAPVSASAPAYLTRAIPAAITSAATQPLTMRFRVFFHAVTGVASIMSWGNVPQDGAPRFFVRLTGTSLAFFFAGQYHFDVQILAETEYVITVTFDGTTLNVYRNGALAATVATSWSGNAQSLFLGSGYAIAAASQNFLLSDFAAWNRALSPAEVAADAQNPWQMFDAGSGSSAYQAAIGALAAAPPPVGAALSGTATAAAHASAYLASPAAALSGSARATALAAAALSTAISLSGVAVAQASAAAALAGSGSALSGRAAVAASGAGALTTAIPLSGSAAASAAGKGALTTGIALSGTAQATTTAAGALSMAAAQPSIDVASLSSSRIVTFDGTGSRLVIFEASGNRIRINDMSVKVPTKIGSKWTVDRDPDEESYYAADITDELVDRNTTLASGDNAIELILQGVVELEPLSVQTVTVAGIPRTYIVVLLGGVDDTLPTDWLWTARVRCANGERFDKTTWFNRVDT